MNNITRILWIDNSAASLFFNTIENVELSEGLCSDRNNFCEYDIVIIDFYDIEDIEDEDIDYLNNEIIQFLKQKKNLYLLNYNPDAVLDSGGSCRDIYQLNVDCVNKSGAKVNKLFNGEAEESLFEYSYIYEQGQLNYIKPIVKSNDGNNSIVGFNTIEEGNSITVLPFCPSENKYINNTFLSEILNIEDFITLKSDLPNWAENYMLPKEIEAVKRINEIREKITDLNSKQEKYKEIIQEQEKYKILFTGTGEPLRLTVGQVFQEIGFEVDFHDEYEEDLNIRYDNNRFLVEVSGVNKGLKYDKLIRHHGRVELEKEKDETVLKGLVVVNTFKDTPLDDRVGKTQFAEENIIPYSKQYKICIMTGLTLLNLFLKKREDKISADEILKLICEADGVLEIEDNYIIKQSEKNTP